MCLTQKLFLPMLPSEIRVKNVGWYGVKYYASINSILRFKSDKKHLRYQTSKNQEC